MTSIDVQGTSEPAWMHDMVACLGPKPVPLVQVIHGLRQGHPELSQEAVERGLVARGDVLVSDGDVVSLLAAADGAVLTHVVTEQEKELEVLAADGDLDLWARLADEGLPLAAGGTVRTRWALGPEAIPDGATSGLTGPRGWLGAIESGDLVGLRLTGGQLSLEKVQRMPELVGEVADRVMAVSEYALVAGRQALEDFAEESESNPGALLDDVLAQLVVDRPDVLRQPLPPVSQLLHDQGLERLGPFVGLPGVPLGAEAEDFSPSELCALVGGHVGLLDLRQHPDDTGYASTVLTAMGLPVAAERIADCVEERPLPGQSVETLIAAAGDDIDRGLALFVASRAAEGRADFLGAERYVEEAVRLIPDCWPVAEEAAMFAAARGNAVAADRLLRTAGADTDHPLRRSMRGLMDLPKGVVSRNRPCPCGSGRKYKACCLREQRHSLQARAELLYARLVMHSGRPGLMRTVGGFVRAVDVQSLPLALDLALFEGGVADDYLRRRGHLLAEDEQALIHTWLATPVQPYEVQEVQKHRSVTLRPLLGGEPVMLQDRAFSCCGVAPLDVMVARPLSNGERPVLLGLPVLVHRMRRASLLRLFREGGYDARELAAFFGPQPPPKFRNRDGDDLVFCEARYDVCDDSAWQRLATTLSADPEDEDSLVLTGREVADDEYLIRGSVHREGDLWTVTANSVERMDELKELVLDAAPDAVPVAESVTPLHEAMASQADEPAEEAPLVDDGLGFSPDEEAALLDGHMMAYERRWVDQQVPALGGITPREAVAAGGDVRAELEMMLDDMAWMRKQNRGGMDPDRIRELVLTRGGGTADRSGT